MTAPLNTAKLGFLLPVVLNPATAAAVGIGLGLLWLLRDDEEEATVDAVPIKQTKPIQTVGRRLPTAELIEYRLSKPSDDVSQPDVTASEARATAPAPTSEADQREMIRKAMSELGKRSAAARATKKSERDNER